MHRYLIVSALGACTIAQAGPLAQRPVALSVPGTQAKLSAPAATDTKQDAGTRHLSDAQRAELRQQLEQFNRQYGKAGTSTAAAPVHN